MTRPLAQLASLIFLPLLLAAAATAQKDASAPPPSLAHDSHAGITISAAPVTDTSRAKHVFGRANPLPAGILPVEVFLRNDSAEPVQIGLDSIELDIHYQNGRMDGVESLPPAQVALLIAHPHGNPQAPRTRRFPIGSETVKDKKVDELADLLRPLALNSDIVPPMGAVYGYLFFDVQHDLSLVGRSSLYIPDAVIVPSKKPLIFFEVSFATP
ncbi:MAG: hypothetical protein KGL02_03985 [Acidobacteriota bacterium]|nr:hypothetical protein [Acidobacteriota bacterium]